MNQQPHRQLLYQGSTQYLQQPYQLYTQFQGDQQVPPSDQSLQLQSQPLPQEPSTTLGKEQDGAGKVVVNESRQLASVDGTSEALSSLQENVHIGLHTFCNNCGKKLAGYEHLCPQCGAAINAAAGSGCSSTLPLPSPKERATTHHPRKRTPLPLSSYFFAPQRPFLTKVYKADSTFQTEQEGTKNKRLPMYYWVFWWKLLEDENVANQVENYNTLKFIRSYRYRACLLLLLLAAWDLVAAISNVGSLIGVFLWLILAFFIYKGYRWAIITAMILWTLGEVTLLVEGYLGNIFWWWLCIGALWAALEVENVRHKRGARITPS